MLKIKRLNLRLTQEEWEPIEALYNKALKRTRTYAPLSDVIKELMGTLPPNLLTRDEILAHQQRHAHGPFAPQKKEKVQ